MIARHERVGWIESMISRILLDRFRPLAWLQISEWCITHQWLVSVSWVSSLNSQDAIVD